jgi:SNF2 family DNA or RNA helicase
MDEARRLKAMLEPGAMSAEPGAVLGVLHKLRQVCTNPLALIDPLASMQPVNAHLEVNPKLAWTIDQLDHIRSFGEKAILFTEFRDLQRLLQRAVGERFAIDVPIVNGDTPASADFSESRQAMIDAFQAKPGFGVIILSTMAVGFGVNVQQANHVIHFTRPWNPAKEDQATDRAYRIGQERTVYVYTPTVIGDGFESFEQRVAARLAARRSLSRDMLAPEQTLTIKDFEGLVID